MTSLRARHAVIAVIAATAGVAAGCGGDDVSYTPPRTTPPMTVPKVTSTDSAATTDTTSTTDTTQTTDTAAATTTPAQTTPTQTTSQPTGGATPNTTTTQTQTQPTGGAGATSDFCTQNPGAGTC